MACATQRAPHPVRASYAADRCDGTKQLTSDIDIERVYPTSGGLFMPLVDRQKLIYEFLFEKC